MYDCKSINTLFVPHFKLSINDAPHSENNRKYINQIPYTNVVGSLMYVMVYTRLDLAYSISILNRCMVALDRLHWKALKLMIRYVKGSLNHRVSCGGVEISKQIIIGYMIQIMLDI